MKLKTLKINPHRINGLGCESLIFADHLTHIYGPNGSGKTPVIKSVVFCLGYPSEFRNDIYERCKEAVLEVEVAHVSFTIIRQFSRDLDIEVIDQKSNTRQRFYKESDFSEFLFGILGLEYPNLISSYKKVVKPFVSTFLPLIFTDQDQGYSSVYSPPKKFIQDQFQEMVRLLFKLPPKNHFDEKKERLTSKAKLEDLDKKVHISNEFLKSASEGLAQSERSSEGIFNEIESLKSELDVISSKESTKIDSLRSFDKLVSQKLSQVRSLEDALLEINRRRDSITIMVSEINSEINALSLNEASRQVFLSFKEICSNPQCNLFSASSDSYAKNLLYLKDQIKDLTRTGASYSRDEMKIQSEIAAHNNSLEELLFERDKLDQSNETEALVASVSRLKDQIFQLQSQLSELKQLNELKEKHVKLLNKRTQALDRYNSFTNVRESSPELLRLKADLRSFFISWLDDLQTPNVSRDITFKKDFEPIMGSEDISQLSGSTKVRAVLAYHAALIEALISSGSPIRLLVLDTPKQHEIHNDDLDRYFSAIKRICEQGDVQVVFSTTEYKYTGNNKDTRWEPKYEGEEQKMFLSESLSASEYLT